MEDNRQALKQRPKKSKHSAVRKLTFLFWCVLFLCIGIGIGFMIRNLGKKKTPTERIVTVSPAPECVAKACIWLSGVDEIYWDYDTVSAVFSDLSVELQGNYLQEESKWQWTVSDPSYVACEALAYEKLGDFFKKIIIAEGNFDADVDDKLTDLLGMPLSDYLKTCDIDLMPSKEELVSKVHLEEQGGASDEK